MKVNLLVSISLCVGAVACVDQGAEQLSETDSALIAANGLAPSALWGSPTVGPGLVSGALDSTNLQTMAASSNSRAVLGYAVYCALTDNQSVQVTVSGTTYTYTGHAGLASTWTTTALSTTQRSAVSGCILSLTNSSGTSVSVSLRGWGLAVDSTEVDDYSLQEGGYWGDLFAGKVSWGSACTGDATAQDDDQANSLYLRECGEDDGSGFSVCGFRVGGLCSDVCTIIDPNTGAYAQCHDGVHATAAGVITAYVSFWY